MEEMGASPESGTACREGTNKEDGGRAEMGSPLGAWPSYNPHNFSQLVRADPSAQPSVVITTEARNILLRHFYRKSEEKLRPKRAAPDNLAPENNNKQPRGPVGDVGGQSSTSS
ncbi:unnamed protein product [Miscanthus lutarioriparius]|uniref:DET1- and DDB1-associated protein 1 n=1 Tax=Miscanthus lutarioriparius TaxID=422564 RepID=A0A811MAV4_9POAL|nr:unnamed protein product [Miscanthus lutarioriparius]